MKKRLSPTDAEALLEVLRARFEQHPQRHDGLQWSDVQSRLQAHPEKLWSLQQMDATGGEPDVIERDSQTGEYVFYDCSPESPSGRRSVCYDRRALDARKEHKPKDSAVEMAAAMGAKLLTEDQYQQLQTLGGFDTKTSSWLLTPTDFRAQGGALFGDRRYGRVFIYQNGASSYYAVRGFRVALRV